MMDTGVKRKRLLKALTSQGAVQLLVDLQPRGAEHFYLMKDKSRVAGGRFPPSYLPFRRPNTALVSYHGSRIIGHIYGLNNNTEIVINRNKLLANGSFRKGLEQRKLPAPLEFFDSKNCSGEGGMIKGRPVRKSSSSSSVSAFVNSPEISSGNERDNSNGSRQTSSSSSTSVALERKSFSKTPQYQPNRQTRPKANGVTQSHDRHSSNDTLPIVCTDENANTSLQTLPLTSRQTRSHQSPVQSSPQKVNPVTPSSKTQRVNSLSISGIRHENGSVSRGEDTTTEEEDHKLAPSVINDRLSSKPSPPSLQVYTTTTQPINSAPSQSFGLSARKKISKPFQSSGRSSHGKQKTDLEPKYADPIAGSTPSFQSRLAELASLEAETVRWERLRKLKKKSRDD